MAGEFVLDPRLESTSVPVAEWPLCTIRLKDDARFHWLLLVPRRSNAVELTDFAEADYDQLCAEMRAATRLVLDLARPDKVNVATLGNVVPQMHVHIIARFHSDAAWPDPVWCHGAGAAYPPHTLAMLADRYAQAARLHFQAL